MNTRFYSHKSDVVIKKMIHKQINEFICIKYELGYSFFTSQRKINNAIGVLFLNGL